MSYGHLSPPEGDPEPDTETIPSVIVANHEVQDIKIADPGQFPGVTVISLRVTPQVAERFALDQEVNLQNDLLPPGGMVLRVTRRHALADGQWRIDLRQSDDYTHPAFRKKTNAEKVYGAGADFLTGTELTNRSADLFLELRSRLDLLEASFAESAIRTLESGGPGALRRHLERLADRIKDRGGEELRERIKKRQAELVDECSCEHKDCSCGRHDLWVELGALVGP